MGGVVVATLVFKFGANLQMRLEAASNILWFYNTVRRVISNTMIKWDIIIKYFKN